MNFKIILNIILLNFLLILIFQAEILATETKNSFVNKKKSFWDNKLSESTVNFNLSQNSPKPFNPNTKIVYSIVQPSQVKLIVTNILGQVVETLVDEFRNKGTYEVNFNAENLSSGLYIYTLEAGSTSISRKMTLLK
jgi:hypothetical protein